MGGTMIFFGNKDRPFHWGPYPLERLPRDASVLATETARPRTPRPDAAPAGDEDLFGRALDKYQQMFAKLGKVDPLPPRGPVPDDLDRRAQDVKGSVYFLDTDQCGICELPESAWYEGTEPLGHSHAVVILIAHGRTPEPDNLARDWIDGNQERAANMRAFEVAIAISEHIQWMGFNATAHDRVQGGVDLGRVAVMAGLGLRQGDKVVNPYLGTDYAVSVVTTDYPMTIDLPLGTGARKAKGLGYWIGLGGAVPGLERNRRAKRRSHMSNFPMEQVKRVDKPTTMILEEEVPRVPKRAEFFERAARGDLGEKAQVERSRFAFKHPFAMSMVSLIRCMVPEQGGPTAEKAAPGYGDPVANAGAVKALSYFFGSEMTGICEVPRYAWYSHKKNGEPIEPYNKYAIVMLIDQGYGTMEGASGDDYISGAQSMRAYMRGAEVAGIMGELFRSLGFPSRSQTNADSEVLHIPLVMWSGLGELSRMGEVALNPFIGPRMKTVVLTTDLPMEIDKPIDFGLQYFCNNCFKCARECPCDAITWGDKVTFNGYEMWKPDVERCARYRLTNPRGLACGRCMKTCPLNKVVTWEGSLMTRVASWCGVNAFWLKPLLVPIAVWLDDFLGNGIRNPVKRWWLDLEIVDGKCVVPPKGVNERDLDLSHKLDPDQQKLKMAYYPANRMPPPDAAEPVPVDRKQALKARDLLEMPDEALARWAAGGDKPEHYNATPPLVGDGEAIVPMNSAKAVWDLDRKMDTT